MYYDTAFRLDDMRLTGGAVAKEAQWIFAHNQAGQVTDRTLDNPAYAFDTTQSTLVGYAANGLNQYTQLAMPNTTTDFAYDPNGNLTQVLQTSNQGGTLETSYTYDPENRLVQVTGEYDTKLRYDPLGRLFEVTDTSTGERRQLLYDGDALIAEYNPSGTMLARYVHGVGAGDDPLVSYAGASVAQSNARFLYRDRLGSVVLSADVNGANVEVLTYDEFGVHGPGTSPDRFAYTGQAWVPEAGLYYYKARMYSPSFGRFMQTDPIGYADGMNLYRYVGNDPVNLEDSTGKYAECLSANGACADWVWDNLRDDQFGVDPFDFAPHEVDPFDLWEEDTRVWKEVWPNPGFCDSSLPNGSTINQNVDRIKKRLERSRKNWYKGYLDIYKDWIENVSPGGKWDYKNQPGGTDDMGNANYGATGSLLFSERALRRAAGFVQGPNPENAGNWWDVGPRSDFGDQPRDQDAIRRGFRSCHGS